MNTEQLKVLHAMRGNALPNYIVPGLTSTLIDNGKLRLFEMSRVQEQHIACLVLHGSVENTIYEATDNMHFGELYWPTFMNFRGAPGEYVTDQVEVSGRYLTQTNPYKKGDWYSMRHDEIHSIKFSKDACVLFFEGPEVTKRTVILEPDAYGKRVPTFKVEPWMFKS